MTSKTKNGCKEDWNEHKSFDFITIIYLKSVLRKGLFIFLEISSFKINFCYCAFVYMGSFVYSSTDG